MPDKLIEGVYAALLTPRLESGAVDESAFEKILNFLVNKRLSGLVLNGATGEFCLTSPNELRRLLQIASAAIGGSAQVICGVGSGSVQLSCMLAEIAGENGAAAILLPPPFFFPYQQEDVAAFFSAVADSSPVPVLQYNLPSFTTPIAVGTAVALVRKHPNIIGIKDSSGLTDILEALTRDENGACRIVGSDAALIRAREHGFCDAVVSGIACVMPELIGSIYERSTTYERDCRRLGELLEHLAPFPTPWGLKWIAEARGLAPARFAQALSPARREQGRALMKWFAGWIKDA